MDIRNLDLNLLVLFDAIAQHKSVNRAAEVMGLSQPATSGALARLRTVLNDPLFVRGKSHMEPTPRAMELIPVVRGLIETINAEVLRKTAFDPAASERVFTVITPDIGEVAFIPKVFRRLRSEATRVRLRAVAMPREAAADALESGHADLAVGFFPDLHKAGFFQQALFKAPYVCIASGDNTALPDRLTTKQYLAATHVIVRPDGREHMLERFLADKGWARPIALEISHFMSLLAILPGSDLIATVPQDIATVISRHADIRLFDLPFRVPEIDVHQFWHRRMHHDPANQWLRQIFYTVNRRSAGEPFQV